jgi:hypothetical protein
MINPLAYVKNYFGILNSEVLAIRGHFLEPSRVPVRGNGDYAPAPVPTLTHHARLFHAVRETNPDGLRKPFAVRATRLIFGHKTKKARQAGFPTQRAVSVWRRSYPDTDGLCLAHGDARLLFDSGNVSPAKKDCCCGLTGSCPTLYATSEQLQPRFWVFVRSRVFCRENFFDLAAQF